MVHPTMILKPPPNLRQDDTRRPGLPSPAASPLIASTSWPHAPEVTSGEAAHVRPTGAVDSTSGTSHHPVADPETDGLNSHSPVTNGHHTPLANGASHTASQASHIASQAAIATYQKLGTLPDFSEVYRVNQTTVLKTGRNVMLQEAGWLGYLGEYTSIPVPRLLDCGTEPETGNVFITMEYVEGEPLALLWDTMDPDERISIIDQVRDIYLKLRRLTDASICGVVPEWAVDADTGRRFRRYKRTGITDNFFNREQGPFQHEEELLFTLAAHLHLRGGGTVWTDKVVIPLLATMPPHPATRVLTHGELDAKNILIKDGKVTAVVDWSQSGFYPVYWEYVKAYFGDIESAVFLREGLVHNILEQRYDSELAVMLLARNIIW